MSLKSVQFKEEKSLSDKNSWRSNPESALLWNCAPRCAQACLRALWLSTISLPLESIKLTSKKPEDLEEHVSWNETNVWRQQRQYSKLAAFFGLFLPCNAASVSQSHTRESRHSRTHCATIHLDEKKFYHHNFRFQLYIMNHLILHFLIQANRGR